MTVHQRRAGRRAREVIVKLCRESSARMFCRGMQIYADPGRLEATIFRVDCLRAGLHVTVPVNADHLRAVALCDGTCVR